MNKMQAQVYEFMKIMGRLNGIEYKKPMVRDAELRIALIKEEAKELTDALANGDLIQVIDGICDLMYVALGTAVAAGIDIELFWEEVHQTNMAKSAGLLGENGKILKPPGWMPPRIKELLLKHIDALQVQILREELAKMEEIHEGTCD